MLALECSFKQSLTFVSKMLILWAVLGMLTSDQTSRLGSSAIYHCLLVPPHILCLSQLMLTRCYNKTLNPQFKFLSFFLYTTKECLSSYKGQNVVLWVSLLMGCFKVADFLPLGCPWHPGVLSLQPENGFPSSHTMWDQWAQTWILRGKGRSATSHPQPHAGEGGSCPSWHLVWHQVLWRKQRLSNTKAISQSQVSGAFISKTDKTITREVWSTPYRILVFCPFGELIKVVRH